jgi:diguanylate cyclase (GGDEF)-like protein
LTDRDPLVIALAALARLLLTDFSVEDVLERLCDAALQLLPVDGAGVAQVDGEQLRVLRSTGPEAAKLEGVQAALGEGPCTTVLAGGPAAQFDLEVDGTRWPRYAAEARRLGIRRIVTVPLLGRDRLWGVLDLYVVDGRALSLSEMEATQVLADAATLYVLSAHDRLAADQAEERLRAQLLQDPLTGLPNRVLLSDRLEHALNVSRRPARSLAVLFVDLDNFKGVNDDHGHRAGDIVLKAVAERLVGALRQSDTVARLSGDEFVIICENLHDRPVADLDQLAAVGHRILDALRVPFAVGAHKINLRASIGAVWAHGTGERGDEILHRADVVMYQAKRAGGDQIVVADAHGPAPTT